MNNRLLLNLINQIISFVSSIHYILIELINGNDEQEVCIDTYLYRRWLSHDVRRYHLMH